MFLSMRQIIAGQSPYFVIPAQAGIQSIKYLLRSKAKPKAYCINPLDSRLRGNDWFVEMRGI
jgi:hypothetical protein